MFSNFGRTSVCELLSIVTRSAAPISSRCTSFQCFSWMWSMSLVSFTSGHCPSPWGSRCCWAFADQTQLSNLIQIPDPTTWTSQHSLLHPLWGWPSHYTYNQTLLLVYLGNGCLDLPHITTAFTQDLTGEAGSKHMEKNPRIKTVDGETNTRRLKNSQKVCIGRTIRFCACALKFRLVLSHMESSRGEVLYSNRRSKTWSCRQGLYKSEFQSVYGISTVQ